MDRPIKLLHIVCDLRRGGTEGQCARTAMGLQRRGTDSRVAVFFREGFFFVPAVEDVCGWVYEIPIRKAVSPRTLAAVFALARHIRRQRFSLVHTWDAEAAVWGHLAARLAGVPLITSRRDLGQIYPRWKQTLLRRADRQALRVVANCQAVADHFAQLDVPRDKLAVIGNILDLEEFDALAKPAAPPSPTLNLVCVSRLDPEKDHDTLLRAFALLDSRAGGATLNIVGSGGQDTALRQLAQELGVADRVVFHGERSDVPALLAGMHIGLLTPRANEGLSNTLLEYMAAGLPIVATNCGGNRELVEGAGCGSIVPIGDPQACAKALSDLLQDTESMQALGRKGRSYVESEHQPAAILARFEALYRDLLRG